MPLKELYLSKKETLYLGFLSVLPVVFNPFNGEIEQVKLYMLILITVFLGLSSFSFKVKSNLFKISLLILGSFALISTLMAENVYLAFWGSPDRAFGSVAIIAGLLLAISIPNIVKSDFFSNKLRIALILSGTLTAFLAVILGQFFGAGLFEFRLGGTLGNPNMLGQFLAISIFFTIHEALKKNNFLAFGISFFLQLYVLMQTGNRASWLALTIVLLLYFAFNFKKNFKYFIIFGLSSLILVVLYWDRILAYESINTRFEIYNTALKAIETKPLFGYGMEHIQTAIQIPQNYTLVADRVHQPFLDIAVSMGIPASIALLILSIYSLLILWKRNKALGLGFLILLLSVQFSFMSLTHWTLFCTFVGIAIFYKNRDIA